MERRSEESREKRIENHAPPRVTRRRSETRSAPRYFKVAPRGPLTHSVPQTMGRTIIVGDVHGCRAELERLLDRVRFGGGDCLVFVGDIVARGPDSLGVLDVVRRTGAVLVRGNHEEKLVAWRRSRNDWIHGR